jgi:hypothetical protein
MRKIQFCSVLLITIAIISSACTSKSYKGRLELSDTAKTWLIYKGNENILFKETNGDSMLLTAGTLKEGSTREIVGCHESNLIGTVCEEYDFVNQKMTLTGKDGLTFQYFLYVKSVSATKWDLCKVSLLENNSSKANAVREVSENGLPHSEVSFNYFDTLQLNGKKFAEVHGSTQTAGYTVYFNHKQGIVGFKLANGQKWAKQ